MQGMPVGNGDVGALCWCEDSKLIFVLNKCDLWDDAPFGSFHNWARSEEERSTTLRHGCRLILDFHVPVFNLFYLSDCRGRIRLADASQHLRVRGPFGSVSIQAKVLHPNGVFHCDVQTKLKENLPVTITLERFGSRSFSHWYSMILRDPAVGLDGTKAFAGREGIYLTHRLTSGVFAAGASLLPSKGIRVRRAVEHFHAAAMTITGSGQKEFSLVAAVTSPGEGDALGAVKQTLAAIRPAAIRTLTRQHQKAWKTFWLRSLMECGDGYLDGLWHLTMFYAACSQRGAYPGRFINGLWTWNRDVQNWGFYFHWNQQQVYWPLNAAGHHELIDSYLRYRFYSLPYARADAREVFKTDGVIVSDVSERRGYNSASEFHNHTPVAQIAMDFWRQYRYTGDSAFLRGRALPYILEAARFFESRFHKGRDGKYHAGEGTGYEGWILLHDGTAELASARALFSVALAALQEAGVAEHRANRWREILANLAPVPTYKAGPDLVRKERGTWTLQRGPFKGEAALCDTLIAAGIGVKEGRTLTSFVPADSGEKPPVDLYEATCMQEGKPPLPCRVKEDLRWYDGIFPWVESSVVYPSGVVGLAQKGDASYRQAVSTAKLSAVPGMGWSPLPIVLARLGLAREARTMMDLWPALWQFYCNGWGHYGPAPIMKGESAVRFRLSHFKMRDAGSEKGDGFSFPMWPFRHMGMESMSVLATAMNESLLQSHDGVIRVAPAVLPTQQARFTLHAQNGFIVSSEIGDGKPLWISVRSKLGKTCRLQNPWKTIHVYANGKKVPHRGRRIIEFPTSRGRQYVIVPDPRIIQRWDTRPARHAANNAAKTHSSGYAQLGLPRMF